MGDEQNRIRTGFLFGITAYLLWGVMPLYFKLMVQVPADEIVAHRILWSLVFLGGLALVARRWSAIRTALADRWVAAILLLTALLVGLNWLIFIHAVVSGQVLEASLGYYLNPLVNVLLGVVLLKERLSRAQTAATMLAAAGVAILAAGAGSGLWISLTLAASFALYGYIRKVAPVGPLEGLWVETLMLAPIALAWLLWLGPRAGGAFLPYGPFVNLLLVLGAAVTTIPLLLFTAAARRLPYSTLGFLQYIAPSLQFLLAIFLFGEPLTLPHMICFGAIWTALLLFTLDGWRLSRQRAAAVL